MSSTHERPARSEPQATAPLAALRTGAAPIVTLQSLLDAWAERGAAIPVAVVASIFDDLLLAAPSEPGAGATLAFADVVVDRRGLARVVQERGGAATMEQVAPLFVRALGGGLAGDDVPPAARTLVERLQSEDPSDRPVDAEQLRQWMRESLGVPAPREEVAASLELVAQAPSCWEDAILLPEPVLESEVAALPRDEAVLDTVHATDVPLESLSPDPSEAITQPPQPADLARMSFLRAKSGDVEAPTQLEAPEAIEPAPPVVEPAAEERPTPVVRHTLKLGNVRVETAPAARRSARAVADPRDSLALPSERPGWMAWLFFAALAIALVLLWLRY